MYVYSQSNRCTVLYIVLVVGKWTENKSVEPLGKPFCISLLLEVLVYHYQDYPSLKTLLIWVLSEVLYMMW